MFKFLTAVRRSDLNFQFRISDISEFSGRKEKLYAASFLNGSQLLLDGAIEIYHILIFFCCHLHFDTLKVLKKRLVIF